MHIKCTTFFVVFFVKFEGFDYRREKKIPNFLKFKREATPVGNRVIVFKKREQYKRESNSCFIVVGGREKEMARCKRSHQLGGKRLHSILFTSKRPHCGMTVTTDRTPLPRCIQPRHEVRETWLLRPIISSLAVSRLLRESSHCS